MFAVFVMLTISLLVYFSSILVWLLCMSCSGFLFWLLVAVLLVATSFFAGRAALAVPVDLSVPLVLVLILLFAMSGDLDFGGWASPFSPHSLSSCWEGSQCLGLPV
jgi:hypothetical protein